MSQTGCCKSCENSRARPPKGAAAGGSSHWGLPPRLSVGRPCQSLSQQHSEHQRVAAELQDGTNRQNKLLEDLAAETRQQREAAQCQRRLFQAILWQLEGVEPLEYYPPLASMALVVQARSESAKI
ncbi:hypothetical protein HPB50_003098 [Hyalomma asiaticum]|uniref:Uncharacterized protein n=1 Tax=Hyalomma asiaticum TaxID=266040 RepID=A0ACB7RHI8_HYAAI|nr:hypothetical protein HPB50_003098 [Hyalomma asiaticum]